MQTATFTTFRDLSTDEAEALLRAHHVGRIAYSWRDHVDVEPIHYVYADGAIYVRTSGGAKLMTLRHSAWLAFEVDECEGLYDWRSVVAHGTACALRADPDAALQAQTDEARRTLAAPVQAPPP